MQTRTVLNWVDYAQFEMACQVLEQAAIPFERHGRTINSVDDPASAFVINQLHLRVRSEDFERARRLLEDTVGRGVAPS
jgi:hypothetical protein